MWLSQITGARRSIGVSVMRIDNWPSFGLPVSVYPLELRMQFSFTETMEFGPIDLMFLRMRNVGSPLNNLP
jgi:hypothetical protein